MELKARAVKNQPLVDQIVGEKLKLAGQTVITAKGASVPKGKNVVVNGDFSQVDAEGKPVGWEGWDKHVSIQTEAGNAFLRVSHAEFSGYFEKVIQKIEIPPNAKEFTFRARSRTVNNVENKPDSKEAWTGARICVHTWIGKTYFIASLDPFAKSKTWTPLKTTKTLPDELRNQGKTLNVSVATFWDAKGTVDIDDIEVEFK